MNPRSSANTSLVRLLFCLAVVLTCAAAIISLATLPVEAGSITYAGAILMAPQSCFYLPFDVSCAAWQSTITVSYQIRSTNVDGRFYAYFARDHNHCLDLPEDIGSFSSKFTASFDCYLPGATTTTTIADNTTDIGADIGAGAGGDDFIFNPSPDPRYDNSIRYLVIESTLPNQANGANGANSSSTTQTAAAMEQIEYQFTVIGDDQTMGTGTYLLIIVSLSFLFIIAIVYKFALYKNCRDGQRILTANTTTTAGSFANLVGNSVGSSVASKTETIAEDSTSSSAMDAVETSSSSPVSIFIPMTNTHKCLEGQVCETCRANNYIVPTPISCANPTSTPTSATPTSSGATIVSGSRSRSPSPSLSTFSDPRIPQVPLFIRTHSSSLFIDVPPLQLSNVS